MSRGRTVYLTQKDLSQLRDMIDWRISDLFALNTEQADDERERLWELRGKLHE